VLGKGRTLKCNGDVINASVVLGLVILAWRKRLSRRLVENASRPDLVKFEIPLRSFSDPTRLLSISNHPGQTRRNLYRKVACPSAYATLYFRNFCTWLIRPHRDTHTSLMNAMRDDLSSKLIVGLRIIVVDYRAGVDLNRRREMSGESAPKIFT
jgi:hypothetical protein